MDKIDGGLKDLIERLEKATGPDRELDCLIATHPLTPQTRVAKGASIDVLLEPRAAGIGDETTELYAAEYLPETNADWLDLPEYTSSIDAALTLVPEGCTWLVKYEHEESERYGQPPFGASITVHGNGTDLEPLLASCAPTPALAICIAALRAREK